MPVNEVGAVLTVRPAEAFFTASVFWYGTRNGVHGISVADLAPSRAVAALVVSITLVVLAYLLIFPAFVALRLREPNLDRPFRVPGGRVVAWLAAGLATGWCALTAVCLLWPGLGTADPDAALPAGFAAQRGQFELLILTPIAVLLAATTTYHLAARSRRGTDR
jgi:amino acid transporter